MHSIANGWLWSGFCLFLLAAIAVDTCFSRNASLRSSQTMRKALAWVAFWVSCALLFNFLLWLYLYHTTTPAIAHTQALAFFTGYVIEKSLSIDNLFAFYFIFQYFQVPAHLQPRVFSYGIWGAIFMRLALILIGVWLVMRFHWVLYLMGVFLCFTGLRMMIATESKKEFADTWVIHQIKKWLRVTTQFHQEHFFIRERGRWVATPLFLALIFIEFSDLVFAFDSIPAIFAITQDPFIVWSSNIFAILGLRALYFVLVKLIHRFALLKVGIALILVFVGFKMLIAPMVELPVLVSLGVIASIIVFFTALSVWRTSNKGV